MKYYKFTFDNNEVYVNTCADHVSLTGLDDFWINISKKNKNIYKRDL